MLLSVCAFGEPHPLQQLQRQLNEAKATQEAVRHAGDGDGAARCVTPVYSVCPGERIGGASMNAPTLRHHATLY
jgi:hypothetical protein